MKERPIIYNTPNVKTVLDGRKSQTRRPCKVKDINGKSFNEYGEEAMNALIRHHSPFGKPGDRLWVRETFRKCGNCEKTLYRADNLKIRSNIFFECDECEFGNLGWKPSIYMPRWASRITLEITDVRVERVQEITYHDVKKEGLIIPGKDFILEGNRGSNPGIAIRHFKPLWNSIYAKKGYGWETNCWVWVIDFRRVGG